MQQVSSWLWDNNLLCHALFNKTQVTKPSRANLCLRLIKLIAPWKEIPWEWSERGHFCLGQHFLWLSHCHRWSNIFSKRGQSPPLVSDCRTLWHIRHIRYHLIHITPQTKSTFICQWWDRSWLYQMVCIGFYIHPLSKWYPGSYFSHFAHNLSPRVPKVRADNCCWLDRQPEWIFWARACSRTRLSYGRGQHGTFLLLQNSKINNLTLGVLLQRRFLYAWSIVPSHENRHHGKLHFYECQNINIGHTLPHPIQPVQGWIFHKSMNL